jgi:Iodothyronine deiodinase
MHAKYHKDVEILLVYIQEAHAMDGRSPMTQLLVEEPVTDLERFKVASTCFDKLELAMITSVIDRVDNHVDAAYQARPDRLYLIGKDGKIAYAGGRGPFGFRPSELTQAIDKELEKIKGTKGGGIR